MVGFPPIKNTQVLIFCRKTPWVCWGPPTILGVAPILWMFTKIVVPPKSSILIGFSMIFTIHFGGKPHHFWETPIYFNHPLEVVTSFPPGLEPHQATLRFLRWGGSYPIENIGRDGWAPREERYLNLEMKVVDGKKWWKIITTSAYRKSTTLW